jgi:hypothetical protein
LVRPNLRGLLLMISSSSAMGHQRRFCSFPDMSVIRRFADYARTLCQKADNSHLKELGAFGVFLRKITAACFPAALTTRPSFSAAAGCASASRDKIQAMLQETQLRWRL